MAGNKKTKTKTEAEFDIKEIYPHTNYVLFIYSQEQYWYNLYIGSTGDLRERLKLHNSRKVQSTKLRKPLELIYYEAYLSESDARRREKSLKLRSRSFAQLKKRLPGSLKT